MADTTYYTAVNLAASPYATAAKSRIDLPLDTAQTENKRIEDVPELVGGDSFELVLYAFLAYQDSQDTHDWGAGATAVLHIRRLNSKETPVELDAAGTVEQVAGQGADYYKITWTVEAGEITSYFGDQNVLLYAVVTDGTEQQHVFWPTRVLAVAGTGADTPDTSEIAVASPYVRGKSGAPTVNDDSNQNYEVGDYWWDDAGSQLYKVTDVTVGAAVWGTVSAIDDWIGLLILQVDAGIAAAEVPLPASTGQPLLIATCVNDGNAAKLTGTIEGVTDLSITAGGEKTAMLQYISTDATWRNFNLDITVT